MTEKEFIEIAYKPLTGPSGQSNWGLNLEKLLENGFCKQPSAADLGLPPDDMIKIAMGEKRLSDFTGIEEPCKGCPLDFDYTGQYVGDTPYPACEVIRDILVSAKEKSDRDRGGISNEQKA